MKNKNVYLTEKKFADKRFRKTEDEILKVFFGSKEDLTVRQVVRETKIARSTFYRHHLSIGKIIPDYRKYVYLRYVLYMRKKMKKSAHIKTLYMSMLLFIVQNKRIFTLLVERDGGIIFTQMIHKLLPKVERHIRNAGGTGKIFEIYKSEVTTILMDWGEEGFHEEKIGEVLKNIMYLTDTIYARLGAII